MTTRSGPDVEVFLTDGQFAKTRPVRGDIQARGQRLRAAVRARHARHRDQGHSRVGGYMAAADYNVYLDDTRGDLAVLSMEYGTGHMDGLYSLTGVPHSVAGGNSSA